MEESSENSDFTLLLSCTQAQTTIREWEGRVCLIGLP